MIPSLSESRVLRILTLCALYVAQGLPFGFVTTALKNHLHEKDVSVAETGGLIAMISIPWTVKFLWGPIVDRWTLLSMGRRRPWLIFAQFCTITLLVLLSQIPALDQNLKLLGWCILSMNIFVALQDVCTDSLAVDLVPEGERGRANGFMYGSSFLGAWLGGTVVGHFLTSGGDLSRSLLVLAGLIFLISLLPLVLRERKGEKLFPWTAGSSQVSNVERVASVGELLREIVNSFRHRTALLTVGFAVLILCSSSLLSIVGGKFIQNETGWGADKYTKWESGVLVFSLLGSFGGGFVADRFGAKRGIVAGGILMMVGWVIFPFAESLWAGSWFIPTMMTTAALGLGLMSAGNFTLFMNLSNRKVAASQFTGFMALLNLSILIGSRSSGWVSDLIPSVPHIYLLCALFHSIVLVYLVLFIKPSLPKTESR